MAQIERHAQIWHIIECSGCGQKIVVSDKAKNYQEYAYCPNVECKNIIRWPDENTS